MAWIGSNLRAGMRAAGKTAATPEAIEKTLGFRWGKAGIVKGPLKVLGIGGALVAGAGVLAYFASSSRRNRDLNHLPPQVDDLAQPLPQVVDFSTPDPTSRQVLGPHTARVLGLGGNTAMQPNLMGGDGASLDGKPGGVPSLN